MFKNYYGKTTLEQKQLVSVGNGTQLVILSVQIFGGNADGVLTLTKYDNSSEKNIAFQQEITVLKKRPVVLQHKIILPANYSYAIKGSVQGISVCLNAVMQFTQSDTNSQIITSSNITDGENSI